MTLFRGLILGPALMLAAVPAGAQEDLRVEGDWTHSASGMTFPERLGNALRTRIHAYDAEQLDVSAGYSLRRGGELGFVTLYVYPATPDQDCAASFAEIERNVTQGNADVKLVAEDRWPSPSGRTPDVGYHARFTMKGVLDGREQPLTSESYLFCPAGGTWLVAARGSWSRAAKLESAFAELLHGLDWPLELDEAEESTGKN
ncbi:hypothetical protein CA233_15185 [Sphingomonas sp. ABOLD]|uniref:Uncharacterized protein n=1 Tax=Sphingomonas trueperi TaxID=53317 RepID=A0A7X5Y0W2_9SPHN|nr:MULTISPECIES: hypothetical protein [Sphingomonas]NJB98560.1 hypothetical protein [Sphingomonas trueperi]RSV44517.1 hypothetical protein CA233_15185 [Sphingomonas sp. ABOLD]